MAKIKAAYMKDDVHLDWKQVEAPRSKDKFIVGLSDGKRVTGFISRGASFDGSGNDLKIIAEGTAAEVSPPEVIAIVLREVSFWIN